MQQTHKFPKRTITLELDLLEYTDLHTQLSELTCLLKRRLSACHGECLLEQHKLEITRVEELHIKLCTAWFKGEPTDQTPVCPKARHVTS